MQKSPTRDRSRLILPIALAASLAGCTGAAGPKGDPGAPGGNGSNGTNGSDGTNGNNGNNGSNGSGVGGDIDFIPVNVALTVADKSAVLASPRARLNGADVSLGYVTTLRSGQKLGDQVYGRLIQSDGTPLKNSDNSDKISNYNDFSSLLKVGSKIFEVTHFESVPAAMYLTELTQDAAGKLTPVSTKPIDFSGVNGLERPCAGSVSPWNSHLGSEEADPDARKWENDVATLGDDGTLPKDDIYTYWGLTATPKVSQAKTVYNPYHYGYITEVAVDESGKATVAKHYATGRRGLELSYVMPDQKTVYLSDDSTNATFYMFVAKTAGNLSEGQLYGMRWFQTSIKGAPHASADLIWVPLGPSATDAQVKKLIDDGIKFSDIFEFAAPTGTTCPTDFKYVNADTRQECLKLKTGMELAASRLETKRYAGYLDGVTTEFMKTEGVTFNPVASRLYLSVSEVGAGMLDSADPKNHMKIAQNKCGMVLELVISKNSTIGSDYVAESAWAAVEGLWLNSADLAYPMGSPYYDPAATKPDSNAPGGNAPIVTNVCSISSIASPDNLTFLPGYDVLLIGEDATEGHQNDIVWAFNVVSHELTRILSTPYGAETTGVYFYPNLGGHAYIKTQVQHPYGESDSPLAPDADARQGYSGYIGPLPPMDK